MNGAVPATDVTQVAVADQPPCPTCGGIEAVRFAHGDQITATTPSCLSCGRQIPVLVKDWRKHGWDQRALAQLERWQAAPG